MRCAGCLYVYWQDTHRDVTLSLPFADGSGQLIGAEHRHMMTPQPLAGLGAAFRTTAEIPATAGRSPQPDEQQSDIHEAAECLGKSTECRGACRLPSAPLTMTEHRVHKSAGLLFDRL
jgi:hypothetical protein